MKHESKAERLLTKKANLRQSSIQDGNISPAAEGEAILKIDRVSVTTNNITYAAFGDAMQYWNFFPTGLEEWGQMPAWGFADVVESRATGVEVGERFYGYYPIASHLCVLPVRAASRGFYDGSAHRAVLTSAYNHYTRCASDPVYDKALENYQILLRPLIVTSFYGADFLQDNGFFGAKQLLISSASSKTAYGTAFCLEGVEGVELIGLTSAKNRAFVEGLGCYHRVVTYDELGTLDASTPTTYVDFSGDMALRAKVHHLFGAALRYDCLAGSAQNSDPRHVRQADIPGPQPELYFAPVQIAKRNKDWGHDEVNRRFGDAQRRFYARVSDPKRPWVKVVEHQGLDAAGALIRDLVAGKIDPLAGHVVVI